MSALPQGMSASSSQQSQVVDYCITSPTSPARTADLCRNARERWLVKTEVYELMSRVELYRLQVSDRQVVRAPSGSLVLYDSRSTKKFRADGAC